MDYVNSDKLIFVLANPGSGGYRLGRILACFDNVFWYQSPINGKSPWSIVLTEDSVKINKVETGVNYVRKYLTPNHFDRSTSFGNIPLIGERIERFWKPEDLERLYTVKWPAMMDRAKAYEIIEKDQHLIWVLHDTPEYLLSRFPNAKIFNLIDTNLDETIDRYLITTAFFPININSVRLKPAKGTHSQHTKILYDLLKHTVNPTYRDFWAWEHKNLPQYNDSLRREYKDYVSNLIYTRHQLTNVESEKYLNISWDSFDIEKIKTFIGSSFIDEHYKVLLQSSKNKKLKGVNLI